MRHDDGPAVRADALLFNWMLGLDAAVDAVGAARAVLAVTAQQPNPPASDQRRALVDGLERFVTDRGRVASLSSAPSSGGVRPRRRWRERLDDDTPLAEPAGRPVDHGDDSDEQRKTRR